MEKLWKIKNGEEDADVIALGNSLNVSPILARLLVQRGISSFEQAKAFFRPSKDQLHDPFLMKDMDRAVERLCQAIKKSEKILVYGDYDVDGTTAVALVYDYLHQFYKNIDFYIPNRYSEGYGISFQGIDHAFSTGCSLIIALDCGIKSIDKIDYANSLGIDFIICDHHTPDDKLPAAHACLNPKRSDCSYPEKELSGCGVGFKFMQAFCKFNGYSEDALHEYLDLVAVSIASDIVPITGENRVIAALGLLKLNTNPGMGLKSIIHVANMDNRKFLISDIVFKIGPRINAAGRIESGRDAVELLISHDENDAAKRSLDINSCNETRKDLDRVTTQEALELINSDSKQQQRVSTVLFKPDWNKGVIGIVASRVIESFYRPTVILTASQGLAAGSARSVDGFDLYKAIESCSDLLENFGGHMYAAGLTIKEDNIPLFKEKFEAYVRENILPEQLIPSIWIDAEIRLKDITAQLYRILKQFEPFGPGNMKPLFVTRRVMDYGTSKVVGKDKDHLKLELIEECSGSIVQGIGFSMGKFIHEIKSGSPFDICYTIEENSFNGNVSLQILLKDIRFPY